MVLIGSLVTLAGYTLVWAGRETLRGCRPVLAELLIPGRYAGCHDGTGGSSSGGRSSAGAGDTSKPSRPPVKAWKGDFGGGGASGEF